MPRLSGWLRRTFRTSTAPVLSRVRGPSDSEVLVVESCHSTWLFDERRHRFRRLLKGIVADSRDASTEWRSYERLELDDRAGTIKVVLNPSGTRLVRAEMHANRCRRCYGDPTGEISLDDLRALVGA